MKSSFQDLQDELQPKKKFGFKGNKKKATTPVEADTKGDKKSEVAASDACFLFRGKTVAFFCQCQCIVDSLNGITKLYLSL